MHSDFTVSVLFSSLLFAAAASGAESPDLGQELSSQDVAAISTTVFPDGTGLPPGSGNAISGAVIYKTQCAHCHGADGAGNRQYHVPSLVGEPKHGSDWSMGYSWPYATSVFDYIRRAMPPYNVKQLSDDEVYAVTAYILEMNKLVSAEEIMDQNSLPQVEMPASQYFRNKWEEEEQHYRLPEY